MLELKEFIIENVEKLTISEMLEILGEKYYSYDIIRGTIVRLKLTPLTQRQKIGRMIQTMYHEKTIEQMVVELKKSEEYIKSICRELNIQPLAQKKIINDEISIPKKKGLTIGQILGGYKFQLDELHFVKDERTHPHKLKD